MKRRSGGTALRAAQELGLALRSRSFRIALLLSLLAHLALFAVCGRGPAPEPEGRVRLMRVLLLPPGEQGPAPPPGPPEEERPLVH